MTKERSGEKRTTGTSDEALSVVRFVSSRFMDILKTSGNQRPFLLSPFLFGDTKSTSAHVHAMHKYYSIPCSHIERNYYPYSSPKIQTLMPYTSNNPQKPYQTLALFHTLSRHSPPHSLSPWRKRILPNPP